MEKLEKETITYPLEINRKKWKKFKDTIPRSITPNDKINEFIDNHIKEKSRVEHENNITT